MDKNAITGLLLIGAILIGWQLYMSPSEEELRAEQVKQDSIARIEAEAAQVANEIALDEQEEKEAEAIDSLMQMPDSLRNAKLVAEYGKFAPSSVGRNSSVTLANELLTVEIQTKGAGVNRLMLKEYNSYDSLPVQLIHSDSSEFDLAIEAGGQTINTNNLYFETYSTTDSSIVLRANTTNPSEYVEVSYTLPKDSYFIQYAIHSTINGTGNTATLVWKETGIQKEKALDQEKMRTTAYYKYINDNPDYLSERSSDKETLEQATKWVSFKQQFFALTLVSETGFQAGSDLYVTDLTSTTLTKTVGGVLKMPLANGSSSMSIYAGPLKYNLIKEYDLGLEDQIDLGWGIFGWISKILIIPVFDVLDGWGLQYGLIILILTLFIKALLFPITYKTYMSSAKMRALKPEIDEINEKYKNKEGTDMQKQQEVMGLYSKTGVNPLAGCIPMLIQFPVLIAMFRFFPASIELRQKSFLWADDLSTYDVIFSWTTEIPLISSFYGNHISGFTLLMAISLFFYTKTNSQLTMNTGNPMQAQQMKIMTYMMPVMMLFFFNSYSSGLSLYYFAANITTMIQQAVIKRFFINEDKIRAKIQENKKKPKKKNKLQQRLEEMQQVQQQQQNRAARRKK